MIRNIIFDIGDVLVKTTVYEAIRSKGFDEDMTDRLMQATYDSPYWIELDRGRWFTSQIIAAMADDTPEFAAEIHTVMRNMGGFITCLPDSRDWILRQKSKQLRVYCLSNMPHQVLCDCGGELGFLQFTDGCLFSCHAKQVKPSLAIYRQLLRRYRLQPSECIYIDDSAINVETAVCLGLHGVLYCDREQTEAEIERIRKEYDLFLR